MTSRQFVSFSSIRFHFLVTVFDEAVRIFSRSNWKMFNLQPNPSSIFPLQHQFPASFTVKLHKKWFNFVLWTFSLQKYFIELSTFLAFSKRAPKKPKIQINCSLIYHTQETTKSLRINVENFPQFFRVHINIRGNYLCGSCGGIWLFFYSKFVSS